MKEIVNIVGLWTNLKTLWGCMKDIVNKVGILTNLKTLWGFMNDIVNIVVHEPTYEHCGVSWKIYWL